MFYIYRLLCFICIDYYHEHGKLVRDWEMTQSGISHRQYGTNPDCGMVFKVMSYNVLSQDLLDRHPYLYTGLREQDLCWESRQQSLINEIVLHNADVSEVF